jgi:hypothetical protein
MRTPGYHGSDRDGLHGLYQACEAISLMTYEGSVATGKILVVKPDHPDVKILIKFQKSLEISMTRIMRKFLETSGDSLCLLCDGCKIYGLGNIGIYDPLQEDLYEIRFNRRHSWSLLHGDKTLMKVVDGVPSLPKEKMSREEFRTDLWRVFPNVTEGSADHLYELVEAALQQKHGTMLVISSQAAAEVARLETQGTPIEVQNLTAELIQSLSSIDGAILMDTGGNCHAFGVILDGVASSNGDRGRGARYNSAIRYVNFKPSSVAIVVSEDGTLDFISPAAARSG